VIQQVKSTKRNNFTEEKNKASSMRCIKPLANLKQAHIATLTEIS